MQRLLARRDRHRQNISIGIRQRHPIKLGPVGTLRAVVQIDVGHVKLPKPVSHLICRAIATGQNIQIFRTRPLSTGAAQPDLLRAGRIRIPGIIKPLAGVVIRMIHHIHAGVSGFGGQIERQLSIRSNLETLVAVRPVRIIRDQRGTSRRGGLHVNSQSAGQTKITVGVGCGCWDRILDKLAAAVVKRFNRNNEIRLQSVKTGRGSGDQPRTIHDRDRNLIQAVGTQAWQGYRQGCRRSAELQAGRLVNPVHHDFHPAGRVRRQGRAARGCRINREGQTRVSPKELGVVWCQVGD